MAANTAMKSTVAEETANVNEHEEMVEVFLPKVPGEPNTKYVAVNGKSWNIPRGKRCKIPKYVYDSVVRAEEARTEADTFSDEEQKKMTTFNGMAL